MNDEIQVEEVVEKATVEKKEEPKRDWKNVIIVGVVMAFAIAGFGIGYSLISKMLNGDTTVDSVYSQYLEKVSADEDLLELYLDQDTTSAQYLFSLYNPTDYAFSGKIDIFGDNSKYLGELEYEMVVPGMYGYAVLDCNKEPMDYMISKSTFYKLNYQDVDFDYEFIYDYDEISDWYGTLCGFDFDMDAAKTISERQYVWASLSGIEFEAYYFFDETVRYYEYEGYEYPSLESALAYAEIDTNKKTVTVYELVDGERVLVNTLTME